MTLNATTTKSTTVRDAYNTGILGKEADASQKAPLGDMLSVLFDAANPNTVVAATTVGSATSQTGATVATTSAATQSASYVQADVQTIATLANALKTDYNKTITDVATIVVLLNQARVDILALRSALATAMTGTLGGLTETHVAVTSNVATMAQAATSIMTVRSTTGTTTGIFKLIREPQHVLATGEVFWNGNTTLTFAAVDAVTYCDLIYSKADLSQKASAMLASITDTV